MLYIIEHVYWSQYIDKVITIFHGRTIKIIEWVLLDFDGFCQHIVPFGWFDAKLLHFEKCVRKFRNCDHMKRIFFGFGFGYEFENMDEMMSKTLKHETNIINCDDIE